jgi:ribosomal protein L37E
MGFEKLYELYAGPGSTNELRGVVFHDGIRNSRIYDKRIKKWITQAECPRCADMVYNDEGERCLSCGQRLDWSACGKSKKRWLATSYDASGERISIDWLSKASIKGGDEYSYT